MNVIEMNIKDLKPYEKNPRKNDKAVKYVAESIKNFGFKVPIVVDKDLVVVTGHTRLKASKKLGLTSVPVVIADDLSEEQIKAFRLADNKVSEQAEWDYDLLDGEINDIFDFDMNDFGFELFDPEIEHEKNKRNTQKRVANILNLEQAQFTGDSNGKYDIPIIRPVKEIPEIHEWIGFNYVLSDKSSDEEKKHKGVHFFIDDYQFERVWNNPDAYVDKLKKYGAVCSPDFSPYGDMPLATQIFNHYRKHWVGAYLQQKGVTVIPTIRKSTDVRSNDFYLEGEPKGGIVMISSMWTNKDDVLNDFMDEYNLMYKKLKPIKIFLYGKNIEGLKGNVEFVKSFTSTRFKND